MALSGDLAFDQHLEADFASGDSDDPDQFTDAEALGGRHKRGVGYSAAGAEEHDHKLVLKGHAPLRINGPRRRQAMSSRNEAFSASAFLHLAA